MSVKTTIDLPDGWRATLETQGTWLSTRLHPNPAGQWGLAEGLWQAIQERSAKQVLLEMDEIDFFSSALMGELVRLHKRIAVAGGRLRACGLRSHPREAMHMLRLDELLPIYESRETALR